MYVHNLYDPLVLVENNMLLLRPIAISYQVWGLLVVAIKTVFALHIDQLTVVDWGAFDCKIFRQDMTLL